MNKLPCSLALLGLLVGPASATLMVDFNSTNQDGGPHNNAGWQPYNAAHEKSATFTSQTYGNITVTPSWSNTTDNRVRQMTDRGAGNDKNWKGTDVDLVTDWLGIDTRVGGKGNGNWDGRIGKPTHMELTLSGLTAQPYFWTSYHHDTEHAHGKFAVWLDTGGGFVQLADGYMSDSTVGGNPASPEVVTTFAEMEAAGSIYNARFTADGTNDVVLRFAPYSSTAVHKQIWGINGFALVPDGGMTLSLLGFSVLVMGGLRRKKA